MPNKLDVIEANKRHPDWTARQIAEAIGACDGYVNATAKRNGLTIAKYQAKGLRSLPREYTIRALGHAARRRGMVTASQIDSIWACTGCGSIKTIEQIRGEHPDAIACCPERKMAPPSPIATAESKTHGESHDR